MINQLSIVKYYRFSLAGLFSLLLSYSVFAQQNTKTNLDLFYSLTDSLVNKIKTEIPENQKKISLTSNLGEQYSLFANSIRDRFIKLGKEIIQQSDNLLDFPAINIVMEGAGVEYGEMFRDGFFGTHYIQRYSAIFGNYMINSSTNGLQKFEITRIDTVKVQDISSLENLAYPFTQASIPPEPFISGLAEPIIAIGTAALVVVLFFTIRSE